MRMGLFAGWIVAALVAWPLLASAGAPDIDKDERALRKYAAEDTPDGRRAGKSRGLCVCLEEPASPIFENKLGFVFFKRVIETHVATEVDMIKVVCFPFTYDRTTGERSSYLACDSWLPLAK